MMLIERVKPIRDKAYRQAAKDHVCDVPGCYRSGEGGDVVLAHINIAGNFGMGRKASDDESFFLCHAHHMEFDQSSDRCRWIVQMIVIPRQRGRYLRWKHLHDRGS